MLQSLQILQFVLQVAVLVLVVVAVNLQSWAVIELKDLDKPSASDDNTVNQLTFAPDGYCLRLSNGSSECQPFLHAILENSRQPDDWPSGGPDALAVLPSHLEGDNASHQDFVTSQALSCWCHTRGELTWYMQGAQNVACLVVLETVTYTMTLWGLFATVSLGLSSVFFFQRTFTACHALTSFTSALLGLLVTLAWWYYSSNYIDRDYLNDLTLNWHHGGSYHCALVAFALATANAQIAFDATGPVGVPKYTRRFIRPTSRMQQPSDWDPLACPANYLV
ncbi:hypothetical protein JG687_00001509 [Phytophthora cactorum]|uniref:Uncharacterized protein n=1 Tax=Phytophthora cactorum TaxID=29920 RepID=A0A329S1S1_9STRA|nr:hypothetical protein Pcac1_g24224 [Phytophthora cactorum]KAG2831122.1 hypothetical protein PC112_g7419 [Phytophthora cactorum]KAG2831206.1 hypothetical protein PC111_g7099 [Phytophthora cactorum]KAG2859572.1 hypothetical protein PC113_g8798 [Phytophthora cactorum]KAG2912181.1 hypothetical protein PC114_g9016 [Phytophthora cactorum]